MPGSVICPNCGAENPDSLIITVCTQCTKSLAGAKPAEAPPPAAAASEPRPAPPASEPPSSAPPSPSRPPERPSPAASVPQLSVTTERPSLLSQEAIHRPPPAEEAEQPDEPAEAIFCDHCGLRNEAGATSCVRCRHPIGDREKAESATPQPCRRCGRVQEAGRKSCDHCGMHFVVPDTGVSVPLSKRRVQPRRGELERAAAVALGCIWAGFAGLIALFILIAVFSR